MAHIIKCDVSGDRITPAMHDVTVLDVDGVKTIVVTDNSNNCVKSYFTRDGKLSNSVLRLDCQPLCINQFKDNQALVTLEDTNQFVIVEVTRVLSLSTRIKTEKIYGCLAVLGPTTLAATHTRKGAPGSCVDILNMGGEVVKSVSTYRKGKKDCTLFVAPDFMCVSKMCNIIVSDFETKTVTYLTPEGAVRWVYHPPEEMDRPTGVTCTTNSVLVGGGRMVIQLTESGQYVRNIITSSDGTGFIWGISIDRDNSLYVCCKSRQLKYFTEVLEKVGEGDETQGDPKEANHQSTVASSELETEETWNSKSSAMITKHDGERNEVSLPSAEKQVCELRRSGRKRRKPDWFTI